MFQSGLYIAKFDWKLRGIVFGKPVLLLEQVLITKRGGRTSFVMTDGTEAETEYWKILTPTGEVCELELRLADVTMVM